MVSYVTFDLSCLFFRSPSLGASGEPCFVSISCDLSWESSITILLKLRGSDYFCPRIIKKGHAMIRNSIHYIDKLTCSSLQTKTDTFPNSAEPDETACNKPPH